MKIKMFKYQEMIKFFRNIRENLLTKGKTTKPALPAGRYFKYAIGEIIPVVLGILIALQINNWNENRKSEKNRQLLITSLIEDFEYNMKELTNNKIKSIDTQLETMNLFFNSKKNTSNISVDSLKNLARDFMTYDIFKPNLTAFNEAESSGSLSQLKNKKLLEEFTKFIQEYEGLVKIEEQNTYTFFNGSTWEFRKTVEPGTIYNSIYAGSTAKELSHAAYLKLLNTPLAQNAFQNSYILAGNVKIYYTRLLDHSENILEQLNQIKTE
jgi:hypothetical protein